MSTRTPMKRSERVKAWAMYCTSLCQCGLLDLKLDMFEYEPKDFDSKHFEIVEVEIKILRRKK